MVWAGVGRRERREKDRDEGGEIIEEEEREAA